MSRTGTPSLRKSSEVPPVEMMSTALLLQRAREIGDAGFVGNGNQRACNLHAD